MSISAQDVKKLRDVTGAGMMDCKKALTESEGNFDAAVEYLQKKGMATAAKKAGRIAAEGLVQPWVSADGKSAVLVEINCETDFVARNTQFQEFVTTVADAVGAAGISSIDELGSVTVAGGKTVPEFVTEQISTIGENLSVRRIQRHTSETGVVGCYIHAGGQIGVLTVIEGATSDEIAQFARDVAMHVAAMKPVYLSPDAFSEAEVAKQTEIFTAMVREEGKREEMIPKIVEGKIRKWRNENSLVEQPFVKNPEVTVGKLMATMGGAKLVGFSRVEVGEGIEKQQTDLAAEVAATLKG
jgi:elongation factor Ts